ncbi:MAG: hypothetical protein L0323_12385 [Planctomycetes bacterium]|nr:hypothetical protein [Planctomycetota bacterium]
MNNTKVVGGRPAVSNSFVSISTDEGQAGLDLNGNGVLGEDVLRVIDLDSGLLLNTRLTVSQDVTSTIMIPGPPGPGFSGLFLVGCVALESQLNITLPFPTPGTTPDINADGDQMDYVALVQIFQGASAPAANGDTWAFGPPASPGVATGFRRIQISNFMMILEQGIPGLPPVVAPLPMALLDLWGFNNPYPEPLQFNAPMPLPHPHFNYNVGAGFNPSVSFSFTLGFPQSDMLAYEQSEAQLGDSNGDGDVCDRVVTVRPVGVSVTALAPCAPNITVDCVCPQVGAVCTFQGVGNRPSVRPDAAFGNQIGFDALQPPFQPGAGPNCLPVPLPPLFPNSGHPGRATAGQCAVAPAFAPRHGEEISVAGRAFAYVIRENANNVNSDQNGDGVIDPSVVFMTDQNAFMLPRIVVAPGEQPAAENVFAFPVQGVPPGTFFALIPFAGNETFPSTFDLNGDGDQNDMVLRYFMR